MYKIKFQIDQQSTQLKYLQQNNCIIFTVHKIVPNSSHDAQSQLLIDFRIKDTPATDSKYSALEHSLRQIFNSIIPVNDFPGCMLKVNVFVLMDEKNIKATILNGCWLAMVKQGIPMKKSVWGCEWEENFVILNLHNYTEVIYGKTNGPIPEDLQKRGEEYKESVLLALNLSLQ